MTYEQMLQQRLRALLETIEPGVTSDLLIAEYQRIHEEVTRIQDRTAEKKSNGGHPMRASVSRISSLMSQTDLRMLEELCFADHGAINLRSSFPGCF